jgi:hypothetical protein
MTYTKQCHGAGGDIHCPCPDKCITGCQFNNSDIPPSDDDQWLFIEDLIVSMLWIVGLIILTSIAIPLFYMIGMMI